MQEYRHCEDFSNDCGVVSILLPRGEILHSASEARTYRQLLAASDRQALPHGLPQAVQVGLAPLLEQDKALKSLPKHLAEIRLQRKEGHVLMSNQYKSSIEQTWLQSDEGQGWKEKRAKLFQADEVSHFEDNGQL